MAIADTVKRKQFDLPDGDGRIRVYWDPETDVPPMPSVSVIKSLRVDPEKEDSLQGWRDRYDGQSQWARPWYEDQKAFKGYRGTLIHFAILSALADQSTNEVAATGQTHFHEVGDSDYGLEEYYAEYCIKKWSKKAPSANTEEVPYTPRNNQYDGEHAWDRTVRDMKWAGRSFKTVIMHGEQPSDVTIHDDSAPIDGRLDPDNVLGVEEYVYDPEYGYGGQFDLLYQTADGRNVLADVKTSSAVRFDHRLQSAAYKRAVERQQNITVEECEIIRLHPDSETVEVSRSPQWTRTLDGLEHRFLALCDKAWTEEYADVLAKAEVELMSDEGREKTEQAELN